MSSVKFLCLLPITIVYLVFYYYGNSLDELPDTSERREWGWSGIWAVRGYSPNTYKVYSFNLLLWKMEPAANIIFAVIAFINVN